MISRTIVIFLILILSLPAAAQTDSTLVTPSWFMTVDGGLLFARKAIESAPSIRMRQGVRHRRFALSVGVGYDSYKHWNSLPVFTGVSFDFVERPAHAWYFQVDAGYSPTWYRRKELLESTFRDAGGYFYHPAVGYRGGVGRVQVHFSIGYKVQNIEWRAIQAGWGWGWSPSEITIDQWMQRLSFLIGIGLR